MGWAQFITSSTSGSRQASSTPRWWKGIRTAEVAAKKVAENVYHPFLNATICKLMGWYYNGSMMKSVAELDSLVKSVILDKDFDVKHLEGFSATRELHRLDADQSAFTVEDGWKESSVKLKMPHTEESGCAEGDAPVFTVPGIWHRDFVEVIRSAFEDTSAKLFHYTPFQLWWKPTPESVPERVYTEVYNSEEFIEQHEKLQQQPPEPGCDLERVVAAVMLWSDSTHLTNFGHASLWPIYFYPGNLSKYSRSTPSDFAAHHLAYIPAVRQFVSANSILHLLM